VYSFNTIFTKLFRMAWVHRYKGLRAKAAGEGSELNAHLPVVPDCELELIRRNHQCRRMPTAIERLSRGTKKETRKAFSLMRPLNAPHGFSQRSSIENCHGRCRRARARAPFCLSGTVRRDVENAKALHRWRCCRRGAAGAVRACATNCRQCGVNSDFCKAGGRPQPIRLRVPR